MERVKKGFARIREEQARIRKEIKEKTVSYILAAFSFVAGLAWNEAVKSFIDQIFPTNRNSVFIKLFYAIAVTVVIVLVTIYLVRLTEKKEENK